VIRIRPSSETPGTKQPLFFMSARSHIRWWVIGLIAVATVINYIDRTSLAVMWPAIAKDAHLTKENYAAIVSAFMVM